MNTIYDLANWFSSKSDMSHKKLQKLCYYAVAWHYALYDSQLVENDEFEAWIHGPVSLSLWHEYKDCVWKPLPRYDGELTFDDETDITTTGGFILGHNNTGTFTNSTWTAFVSTPETNSTTITNKKFKSSL